MKLTKVSLQMLFEHEKCVEIDWDAGQYWVEEETTIVGTRRFGPYWVTDLDGLLPEEIEEWLPER